MSTHSAAGRITLRKPLPADGLSIHRLIEACPPLDLNSTYCYFLLSGHFAQTCVVAEQQGEIAGFLSAYLRPDVPDTLFVWQVAVAKSLRGRGVAGSMLSSLLSRPECIRVRWLETTVGPSNVASRSLFTGYACTRGIEVNESLFLDADAFGGAGHESEHLLRLGPLTQP